MFILIAGLLFPGLGYFLQRQWVNGSLVAVGVLTPLLWIAMMLNQALNDGLHRGPETNPALLLDGRFLTHWGSNSSAPAHVFILLFLVIMLHLSTAWAARIAQP
jgi:hypothetical protein